MRNVTCLDFARSVAFCEENGGIRQQFNEVTHFFDASMVYGSNEKVANSLRSFVDGKLLVGMFDLLPTYENGTEKAGDERATEMPGLG